MVPPMGEPNATETPQAMAALMISRFLAASAMCRVSRVVAGIACPKARGRTFVVVVLGKQSDPHLGRTATDVHQRTLFAYAEPRAHRQDLRQKRESMCYFKFRPLYAVIHYLITGGHPYAYQAEKLDNEGLEGGKILDDIAVEDGLDLLGNDVT